MNDHYIWLYALIMSLAMYVCICQSILPYYVGVDDSHIDSNFALQIAIWSPIYKLGEDYEYQYENHASPIWIWEPLMIRCTLLLWLVCFIFWSFSCMREYHLNITWIVMNLSILGVACFSWSTHLMYSTKHLQWLQITTSMSAFQAPCLSIPLLGSSPLSREKWSLQEPFLTVTWNEFSWLIKQWTCYDE